MAAKADVKRMIHYDLLRIFAAFSVVMLHSAAQFWYALDIHSTEWFIANSYDALFRFGVPIFVMISGALFLSPKYQLDIKHLYKHNILRLLVLYVLWSAIYGLWDSRNFQLAEVGLKPVLREIINGRYHLWFLPMIIGIYMLLPLLKVWVEHAEKKNLQYFLGLFFFFQICSETLRALTVMDELHTILNTAQLELVCSYVGYFVWGYYIAHVGIGAKLRRMLYVGVIPACLCNVLLSNFLTLQRGVPEGSIYDSFGFFTFVVVSALFVFTQEVLGRKSFGEKSSRILKEVSASTLGIYVMHMGLMEELQKAGIHCMLLPNIIGIPLYAILCFGVCMLAAMLLRRIPIIGKYLC